MSDFFYHFISLKNREEEFYGPGEIGHTVMKLDKDVGFDFSKLLCGVIEGPECGEFVGAYSTVTEAQGKCLCCDEYIRLVMLRYQDGEFIESSNSFPEVKQTHHVLDFCTGKGNVQKIVSVKNQESYLIFKDDCVILVHKNSAECLTAFGKYFPITPTNDILLPLEGSGKPLLVRNGELLESDHVFLYSRNKLGKESRITASLELPNGDFVIGCEYGDIYQIRLNTDGNKQKSYLVGYLNPPVTADHIVALPNSKNYLIGSTMGVLRLAQFEDNRIKLVEYIGDNYPIYSMEKIPEELIDIIPLSNNSVAIFTARPKEQHEFKEDPFHDNCIETHHHIHWVKISNEIISIDNWLPFGFPSTWSSYLLLPDNKLLIGDAEGGVWIVWDKDGTLMYQEVVISPKITEVSGMVEWIARTRKEMTKIPRTPQSTKNIDKKREIGRATAQFHLVVNKLLLVGRSDDEWLIFIQRKYRLGKNNISETPDRISDYISSGGGYIYDRLKFNTFDEDGFYYTSAFCKPGGEFYDMIDRIDNSLLTIKTN